MFVFFFTFPNPYIVDPNHENQVVAMNRLIGWDEILSQKGFGGCFQRNFINEMFRIFLVCLNVNDVRSQHLISVPLRRDWFIRR